MLRYSIVPAIALLTPALASAQADVPPAGTRVRLTPAVRHAPYVVGTIVGQAGDRITILLPTSDTVRVSLDSLELLEVSQGVRGNGWKGAGYGFLIGAAAGGAIGAAAIDSEWRAIGALLGMGVGGLGGMFIGGGVGSSIRSERWKPAPGWELSFSVQPTAAGIGISIRF